MADEAPWLQQLKRAEAYANAGRLADAEAELRQILTADPNQPDALNALGALALAAGRLEVALKFQQRAVSARPNAPLYWSNLGEMHRRAGDLKRAVECGEKAVALRPSFAQGHNNLGVARAEAGEFAAALKCYDAALAHKADFAEAHNNRGNALRALGRTAEVEAAFNRAIELRPNYAEAHANLGNVLRDAGRTADAEQAYRRSLALRPGDVGALFNLSLALEEQGKAEEAGAILDEVIAAARRVLAQAPHNAEAANALGLASAASGRYDDAVEAFRRAAAKPGYAEPWLNLGNALKELGRFDEALAAFDKARELAPHSAGPLLGAGQVKTFRAADDPHLAALEALARDLSALPRQQRLQAHFALGKAYDDLGRADEAFANFRAGNTLKRQSVSYDEARTLAFFARVKAVFDAAFMSVSREGCQDDAPIFVIGMPRSGTTLVEQILSSHARVGAAGEIGAMNDAARTLGAFPDAIGGVEDGAVARAGEAYVRKLRTYAPNAAYVTDKAPSNFFLIGLIHLALPRAKIVLVTRDPMDTCLSCYSKLFTRGQDYAYDLGELGRYYRAQADLMRHWREVLPQGRMLDLRYEDVVADIEGQARRLLTYCGLDWDEQVLRFHQNARAVGTASASQVRQPLYASSIARWRRYENQLKPLLEALGDLAPAV